MVEGVARRQLVASVIEVLGRAGEACLDVTAAVGGDEERGIPVNWRLIPWKKLVLVALAGAVGAAAAVIPPSVLLFGLGVQKALLVASGLLAGWAKRAPGDVKALPPT